MSAKDRTRWEVQWHPASGARIRRLVFTWGDARRLMLILGIAAGVVAGGLVASLGGFRTRRAGDGARSENTALRARQEALRDQLEAIETELAASRVESGGTQESAAAPVARGEVPAGSEPSREVADEGSAKRQEEAPAGR